MFQRLYKTGFVMIVFVMLLTGICDAAPPTTEITDTSKKAIIDYLAVNFLKDGYNMANSNEYQVEFRKLDNSFGASLVYGSRYNGTPEQRIRFNIVQLENKIMLTVSSAMVTNPNSGFESATDVTERERNYWQEYLDKMKGKFNGFVGYGFVVAEKKKQSCFVIESIDKASSAEQAGLKPGDFISAINGKSVEEMRNRALKSALEGPEGTMVAITIKTKDGKTQEYQLKKTFIRGEFQKS